jgi:hypothetical protein
MTIFAMCFVELLTSRYDMFGVGVRPALDLIRAWGKQQNDEDSNGMKQ